MSELSRMIHKRKYIRSQITKIHGELDTFSTLTDKDRGYKKALLDSYFADLQTCDAQVQTEMWKENKSETEMTAEYSSCDSYNQKILECGNILSMSTPRPQTAAVQSHRSHLQGHTVPLPEFHGRDSEDINVFISQFEQANAQFSYNQFELFLILKKRLHGSALNLIEALQSNQQSYADAIQLLKEAYASPELQTANCIKQLMQMKLNSDGDPFEYFSKIRKLAEMIENLKIDASSFLRYFFWQGLPESFKTIFIQSTKIVSVIYWFFWSASAVFFCFVIIIWTVRLEKPGKRFLWLLAAGEPVENPVRND